MVQDVLDAIAARPGRTARTKVAFILVNDIYQMSEQVMIDGPVRGGFARLAAIAKAEGANSGHVVIGHADTVPMRVRRRIPLR